MLQAEQDTDELLVRIPVGSRVAGPLAIQPRTFTPNGDGANDVAENKLCGSAFARTIAERSKYLRLDWWPRAAARLGRSPKRPRPATVGRSRR